MLHVLFLYILLGHYFLFTSCRNFCCNLVETLTNSLCFLFFFFFTSSFKLVWSIKFCCFLISSCHSCLASFSAFRPFSATFFFLCLSRNFRALSASVSQVCFLSFPSFHFPSFHFITYGPILLSVPYTYWINLFIYLLMMYLLILPMHVFVCVNECVYVWMHKCLVLIILPYLFILECKKKHSNHLFLRAPFFFNVVFYMHRRLFFLLYSCICVHGYSFFIFVRLWLFLIYLTACFFFFTARYNQSPFSSFFFFFSLCRSFPTCVTTNSRGINQSLAVKSGNILTSFCAALGEGTRRLVFSFMLN